MKSSIKPQAIKKAQIEQYALLAATVESVYDEHPDLFGDRPHLLPLQHLTTLSAEDASAEYETAAIRATGYATWQIGTFCELLNLKVDIMLGPPPDWKDWVDRKESWTPIYVIDDGTSKIKYPASSSYMVTKRYVLLNLLSRMKLFTSGTIQA